MLESVEQCSKVSNAEVVFALLDSLEGIDSVKYMQIFKSNMRGTLETIAITIQFVLIL